MELEKSEVAKILAANEKYLKVSVIEKDMGLKPTVLKRMIARQEIPEKFEKQVEKWWDIFLIKLMPKNFTSEEKHFFTPIHQPIDKFGTMPEKNNISEKSKKTLEDARRQYPINSDDGFEHPQPDNSEIEKQIQTIRDEKIPKERDTRLGRYSWEVDQNKRITELQKLLK